MPTQHLAAHIFHPPFNLARHNSRPNTGRMERFLKKCGISVAAYARWSGRQPLKDFAKENPTWSQRSWEVLIIENLEVMGATLKSNERRA